MQERSKRGETSTAVANRCGACTATRLQSGSWYTTESNAWLVWATEFGVLTLCMSNSGGKPLTKLPSIESNAFDECGARQSHPSTWSKRVRQFRQIVRSNSIRTRGFRQPGYFIKRTTNRCVLPNASLYSSPTDARHTIVPTANASDNRKSSDRMATRSFRIPGTLVLAAREDCSRRVGTGVASGACARARGR